MNKHVIGSSGRGISPVDVMLTYDSGKPYVIWFVDSTIFSKSGEMELYLKSSVVLLGAGPRSWIVMRWLLSSCFSERMEK